MNRALTYTAGVIGLAIGIVAGSAVAQTTANGPYYATPSWDQQLPAATRFIVLSNWASAAVLDRETGLVWEKTPEPTPISVNWFNAIEHCSVLNTGGRLGWRLPTLPELQSLVDISQSNPALPAGHPFTGVLLVTSSIFGASFHYYWSATTVASDATRARRVSFVSGTSAGPFLKDFNSLPGTSMNVWCVRGGAGIDPQ